MPSGNQLGDQPLGQQPHVVIVVVSVAQCGGGIGHITARRLDLRIVSIFDHVLVTKPLRYPLIQFTRKQLAREDRTGKRGLWLSTLDRFGLGFNS